MASRNELRRRLKKRRAAYRWRLARTRKWLARYKRTKSPKDLAAFRRSRQLLRRHRAKAHNLKRAIQRATTDNLWGGCRGVTNYVIQIVGKRARVGSRKRTATYGNPGSDHHVSQRDADAVDFRIANAHTLKNEIARKLGRPLPVADYESFPIKFRGKAYRVQIIAATHGTGPHLHVGVRRIK